MGFGVADSDIEFGGAVPSAHETTAEEDIDERRELGWAIRKILAEPR